MAPGPVALLLLQVAQLLTIKRERELAEGVTSREAQNKER